MRNRPRLEVGKTYAYLTVLEQITESVMSEMRVYRVRAECCGAVAERKESSILDAARKNRANCQACRKAEDDHRQTKEPGERFGPVVIVSGSGPWRVRWDCCEGEATMTHKRLLEVRNQARYGKNLICRECANEVLRGQPRPQYREILGVSTEVGYHSGVGDMPSGLISAAVAWPRPRLLVGNAR